MISVDQNGNVVIKLTTGGDATVSVSLSNVSATATDQAVYDTAVGLGELLDYPIASITRNKKILLIA